MAILAIKGNPKRGNEVIEILEMLGGRNLSLLFGDSALYYAINRESIISTHCEEQVIQFSLEEFLEKFPYKVGDKVQHKGATSCGSIFEVEKMRWEENTVKYTLCLFGCNYKRSTLPVEYLQPYKEETMEDKLEQITFDIPNGYEFFGINDDNQVVLAKKQPKYPKTYEECCEVLKIPNDERYIDIDIPLDYNKLLSAFTELLICRDAYWKIAGEQMELGKPWDSRYGCGEWGYWIGYSVIENKIDLQDSRILVNHILVFPTEEMRDMFYENFKDLIENCKELL